MAQVIYTLDELVALGWTEEEISEEIAKVHFGGASFLTSDQKRHVVEWSDYSSRMQVNAGRMREIQATDWTGRDAQTFSFDRETMSEFSSYYLTDRANDERPEVVGKSFVLDVAARKYRNGDRILRLTESVFKERVGYSWLPTTIRVVEVYDEIRHGKVRIRCVIEEALARLDAKERSFEMASTDDRRKTSQNNAAAEARKAAKAIGGKALTGTPAQKKWAEDIRKSALTTVSAEVADKLLAGKAFQSSKWWIDNRRTMNAVWLTQQTA